MKKKIHKAPSNLRDSVDNKINFIEGLIDLGELFFKNTPSSLINSINKKDISSSNKDIKE